MMMREGDWTVAVFCRRGAKLDMTLDRDQVHSLVTKPFPCLVLGVLKGLQSAGIEHTLDIQVHDLGEC